MQVNNKQKTILMALGIWLSTVLLFSEVRNYGFVAYDDGQYVYQNEMVQKGLSAESLRWVVTEAHFHMWHPLTTLSHLVDIQIFGMNPGAHHLINVLIHSLNAALLFFFLLRATGERGCAFLVALLFAWHPLRVESVVWISERKDVLCTLFWLLTFHAYLRYVRLGTRKAYWLAVAVYAAGILTKPMIVTLPCVLLLLDFWPLRRFETALGAGERGRFYPFQWSILKPLLWEKAPFFILCAVLAVLTYKMQHAGDVLAMMESTKLVDRLGNAMVSYTRYIGKLFWPVDLAVLYPHPGKLPLITVLGALVVLAGITAVCWWQRLRRPWLAVGWMWFLGVIVPASGIIQAGGQAMADRYTYVSTIGLLVIVVWTLKELVEVPKFGRNLATALAAIALAGSLSLTIKQIQYWRDTETLFRHATQVTKKNSIAHFMHGYSLLEKDRVDEAIQQFETGLEFGSGDRKAWFQLGRAWMKKNELKRAIACFQESLRIDPAFQDARLQLATALAQTGQVEAAEIQFREVLKSDPNNDDAWGNLGNVQYLRKDYAGAEASYLQAIKLNVKDADAWLNLANLYLEQGNGRRGLESLERALQLKPEDARLWYQYAGFCEQYGAGLKAVQAFRQAVRLAPERSEVWMRLAWRLSVDPAVQARNGKEALAIAEKLMAQAGGTSGPVGEILAAAKAESGLYNEAVFWAESALKVYQQANDASGQARLRAHLANYRQSKPWRTASTP
jgi:tetratricopeptide (TPR) repeat protein